MVFPAPRDHTIHQSPLHQVDWNPSNLQFCKNVFTIWRVSDLPCLSKIGLCFTKCLSWIGGGLLYPLRSLCRRLILPVAHFSEERRNWVNLAWENDWLGGERREIAEGSVAERYTPSRLQIKTPDGAIVNSFFYSCRGQEENQDIPTFVCFNGNGTLAQEEMWDWLLQKGLKSNTPFNVVVVDYRTSKDISELNRCVLDGMSVVQVLHEQYGIAKNHIMPIGWSMGGAVATKVREADPELGNCGNILSYSSICDVIQSPIIENFMPPAMPKCLQAKYPLLFIKKVASGLISLSGWNLDVTRSIASLDDHVVVVYHPEDRVIPEVASAKKTASAERVIRMEVKPEKPDDHFHHLGPLKHYRDAEDHSSVAKKVINMMFERDVFVAEAGVL